MKQTINPLRIALAGVLLAISGWVQADGQLMVMPARTTIEGNQNRSVQVSNLGDKPLYLKIDLVRVENPGEKPERKTPIGDITVPEMMANPAKLTLGPGQKRDINLVVLKVPAKETIYRLYIVPVNSIKVVGEESKDKIKAPITFGVAYGVLVDQLPSSGAQVHGWSHQCTPGGLQLTTTGNVHALFSNLQAVPAGSMPDEQKIFPGLPRVFPAKALKGEADGKPFDLRCQ